MSDRFVNEMKKLNNIRHIHIKVSGKVYRALITKKNKEGKTWEGLLLSTLERDV